MLLVYVENLMILDDIITAAWHVKEEISLCK